MVAFLIIVAIALVAFFMYSRKSEGKREEAFRDRPSVIVDPEKDLSSDEKYAIVGMLAWIQGASSLSAYDDEANEITQSVVSSLGLSMRDVGKFLSVSLKRDPMREMKRIYSLLSGIRDKNYLTDIYKKCMRIADISQDREAKEVMKDIFRDLGVPVDI